MDGRKDPAPAPVAASQRASKPIIRQYAPGDEQQIVNVLRVCHAHSWGKEDGTLWRWKHGERPGFSADDVLVATIDGSVVACFHSAVMPLQLEPGLAVPVSFDGDFAVLPECRGQDLSGQAYDITDRRLLEQGVVLRGGFTSRELNEGFYQKRFGYVFVSTAQTTFRKIIALTPLQEKFAKLGNRLLRRGGLRRSLSRRGFVVDILVQDFPPAHIEMKGDAFCLHEGYAAEPDLTVRMPYSVLLGVVDGPRDLLKHTVGGVLTGRFRVGGLLRSGPRLIAICWALLWRA